MIMFAFLCGLMVEAKAQTYNLAMGTNVSTYLFQNSDGVQIDFLKKGSGSHFQIGTEFQLLDTTNDYSTSSKKAIYFSQRQQLAKFLTRLHADVQVESNQFNAVGDQQNIAFSYQTNFVGLSGGFGYQSPSYKNWTLALQGRLAVHKLIPGEVWLSSALAVALSIVMMQITKTLHPPGGATALIANIGSEKIQALGFIYVLSPV